MQKSIGFILGVFSVIASADVGLSYELSFGEHLQLRNSGQAITITARNDTDMAVNCMYFALMDGGYRHDPVGRTSANPRLGFQPKDTNSGCSTWCSPIAHPPPYMVAWHIAGPLAPGEEKVCEYEVQIYQEFEGTITLSGTNGPVFVTRVLPEIPTLNKIGIGFLFFITLFLGFAHFRAARDY